MLEDFIRLEMHQAMQMVISVLAVISNSLL